MIHPDADASGADDDIDSQAILWLIEQEEGFAPDRQKAFDLWRNRDPRHAAAVARFDRSLQVLGEISALTDSHPAAAATREVAAVETANRRFLSVWLSFAGVAAAFVIGFLVWSAGSHETAGNRSIVTGSSPSERIELPDGSVVNVNAQSRVQIQFTKEQRGIRLLAGEAHFKVAHDTSRPFIVTTENFSVKAVGTEFNVRVESSAVDVLVTEGKVQLLGAAAAPQAGEASAPLVVAGEHAAVPRRPSEIAPVVEKAERRFIREALSWHTHEMRFSDVPLRDVVKQFNLRNETQLVIVDPALGDRRIGGTFALDEVEAFVRLLEKGGAFAAEANGKHEILLRQLP